MAWIADVPPSPRHPKRRWQVRYQDGSHQRSAGTYLTREAAEKARKRVERGLPPSSDGTAADAADATKALTLFGDYVTTTWWPTWRDQHPDSAHRDLESLSRATSSRTWPGSCLEASNWE